MFAIRSTSESIATPAESLYGISPKTLSVVRITEIVFPSKELRTAMKFPVATCATMLDFVVATWGTRSNVTAVEPHGRSSSEEFGVPVRCQWDVTAPAPGLPVYRIPFGTQLRWIHRSYPQSEPRVAHGVGRRLFGSGDPRRRPVVPSSVRCGHGSDSNGLNLRCQFGGLQPMS